MPKDQGIGASVKRREDVRFLTGKGRYTDDINRPGQAHVHFLRSDVAHGRIARLAEEAAREADRRHHAFERVGVEFLRHQPDHRPRGAIVAGMIMPADGHRSRARRDDAADDADHRRLARAVRPEQRENLALVDR